VSYETTIDLFTMIAFIWKVKEFKIQEAPLWQISFMLLILLA
jgi:hypothetical protein